MTADGSALRLCGRWKNLDPIPARLLRVIQCLVRSMQQCLNRIPMIRVGGKPNGYCDESQVIVVVDHMQRFNLFVYLLCALLPLVERGVGKDECEFVTPIPGRKITASNTLLEQSCKFPYQCIAGRMAVSVIDQF